MEKIIRKCHICKSAPFTSQKDRWDHYVDEHPKSIEDDIVTALQDIGDGNLKWLIDNFPMLLASVAYYSNNYADRFPKINQLVLAIKKGC